MPWVKLDDHFDENAKVSAAGPLGIALYVTGLAYCNRNLSDGFIPWATARSLLSWEYLGEPEASGRQKHYRIAYVSGMQGDDVDSAHVIDRLIETGLWEEVPGGYRVHDYDQYQPSKAEVEAERDAARARMGRVRGKSDRSSADVRANNARSSDAPDPVSDPDPVPVTDPNPQNPPTPRKRGSPQAVDEQFITSLVAEYAETWTEAEVRERVEAALNHKASDRWKDKRLGVRGWLRRDAARETPRRPTPIRPASRLANPFAGMTNAEIAARNADNRSVSMSGICGVEGCDHSGLRGSWLCMVRSAE